MLAHASQRFAGHLAISFQNLDVRFAANTYTVQAANTLGTGVGFQTNDYLSLKHAACSGTVLNPDSCTSNGYLGLLDAGIYPLGPANPMRAPYIEVLAADANAFPGAIAIAHDELFGGAFVGVPAASPAAEPRVE